MTDSYFPQISTPPHRGRQYTYTPTPAHLGITPPPSESSKLRNKWLKDRSDQKEKERIHNQAKAKEQEELLRGLSKLSSEVDGLPDPTRHIPCDKVHPYARDYSVRTPVPMAVATMVASAPIFPTALPPPRRTKKNPNRALMGDGGKGGSEYHIPLPLAGENEGKGKGKGKAFSTHDRKPIQPLDSTRIDELPPHLIPNSYIRPFPTFPSYDYNSPLNKTKGEGEEGWTGDRVITLEEIPDSEYKLPHILRVKPGDTLCTPDPAFTPLRIPTVASPHGTDSIKSKSTSVAPPFGSKSASGGSRIKPTSNALPVGSNSTSSAKPKPNHIDTLPPSSVVRSTTTSDTLTAYPYGRRPTYRSSRPRTADSTLGRPELRIQTVFPDPQPLIRNNDPPHIPYNNPDLSTPPADMPPSVYGRRYVDQRKTCSTLDLGLGNNRYPVEGENGGLTRYTSVRVNRPLPRIPDERDPVEKIFMGGSGKPKKGGLEMISAGWSSFLAKAKKGKLGKSKDLDKEDKSEGHQVVRGNDSPSPVRFSVPSLGYNGVRGTGIDVSPGERDWKAAERRARDKERQEREENRRQDMENAIQLRSYAFPTVTPPTARPKPPVKSAGYPWPGVGEVPEEYRSTFSSPSFGTSSSRGMEVEVTLGEVGAEVLREHNRNLFAGWEAPVPDPTSEAGKGFGWGSKDGKKTKGQGKKERERPGTGGSLKLGLGGIVPRFGVRT